MNRNNDWNISMGDYINPNSDYSEIQKWIRRREIMFGRIFLSIGFWAAFTLFTIILSFISSI
ncbi:MAG: hypothetical protein Q8N03_16180 [Ignavibacteria bacterium]|nr:hypothetical protein [Ignavibacteria bacterium]